MDIRFKRAYDAPSADDDRQTLAYGSKDEDHNNAVALREYLREEIRD